MASSPYTSFISDYRERLAEVEASRATASTVFEPAAEPCSHCSIPPEHPCDTCTVCLRGPTADKDLYDKAFHAYVFWFSRTYKLKKKQKAEP